MQLLVSVATARDARAALLGGADIIDAKDPTRGALGAVAPSVLRAILATVASCRPVSAALGDIGALVDDVIPTTGLTFVKLGVTPNQTHSAAATRAASVVAALPHCDVIFAAYADVTAGLHRDDIVAIAQASGARGVLLDTANKRGGGLFDVLGEQDIGRWVETAHAAGLTVALAGRLGAAELHRAAALGADIGGVRGAVCAGGRAAQVSAAKVRALATARRETAPTPGSPATART